MSLVELTSILCKIVGIQSEIINRQSEALAAVDAYDEETERLMDRLENAEQMLDREIKRRSHD